MINAIKQLLNVGKGKILLGDEQGVAKPVKLYGDISVDSKGKVSVLSTIVSKIGEYFSY